MGFCPACGHQQTDTEAQFCSNCGRTLQTEPTASITLLTSDTSGADDEKIPAWLGWLAIPSVLLLSVVGLGIYCLWAYRRGRMDAAGQASHQAPFANFGWRILGWSAFALLPVLGCYAAVYLSTMCYKHGLRVGARMQSRSHAFTSLPAFAAVAAAALILVASFGFAAFALAASGGSGVRDLKWEVLAPNTGQAVTALGDGETIGIRSLDEHQPLTLIIKVTNPLGFIWQGQAAVNGSDWVTLHFPDQFSGDFGTPDTQTPGLYNVTFEVNGVEVGEDSWEIRQPPPNSSIDYVLDSPFRTQDGSWVFNATVKNNSTWRIVGVVISLNLEDGSGNPIYQAGTSIRKSVDELGPGDVRDVGVALIPSSVIWELYSTHIEWEWRIR